MNKRIIQLNKQQSTILHLLRTAGGRGINSYDLRFIFHLIQAPVRIKELKGKGFRITTRKKVNRSVDYILVAEPGCDIVLFGEAASAGQQRGHLRSTDTAPRVVQPVQETLFGGGAAYA